MASPPPGGRSGYGAAPPSRPSAQLGHRMRNVSPGKRSVLKQQIRAAEKLCTQTGPVDRGITPYSPGKRVSAKAGGGAIPPPDIRTGAAARRATQCRQAIVRRFDGGRRLEVLTQGWAGAPPVMTQRNPSIRDLAGGAVVPALLRNGEIVDFEDDWESPREYVFIRARRREETCSGFVERCHLKPFDLSVHPKEWEGPSERPELEFKEARYHDDRMKTRRQTSLFDDNPRYGIGYPRRELRWRVCNKDMACPVLLTSARDGPNGTVVPAAPIYKETQSAADRIAGFAPRAAPKHVVVCAR
eukprot:Hpha_TRINITY_DN14315_c0_g1::TRINITY_DN14315_c0_g1_i1::g.86743::m.86743